MDAQSRSEQLKGIYFASAAFVMWGFVPVYFKLVDQVSALEVLAHRVLWSVLFLALYILVTKRSREFLSIFRQPKVVSALALSAIVISLNWLVFIWAVGQDRIVETTLGYFINPLINILFGMAFFGERLRSIQWVSVCLAAGAVAYQVILLGELPWVALTLAGCFSAYSVLRKKIPVDSVSGLLIETLWLLPIALAYMGWLFSHNEFQILSVDNHMVWLLLGTGLVTSLPLLAFASGARRLSLTLIGLLQYIGPSIAFLIAVFYYHEPMDERRLVTFILIWIALALFSAEGILFQRRRNRLKG
ncbi:MULTISPECIES: EamA family transporter RarD [unclassified Neptuniibacter]|uniref:EamA family transporter RarD n=1 Tax=unclassified Neptuniibacter TaxID=2630693 RepID=UPI0026E1B35C|nr:MULTISPECIES: EamA family transporter RarD [unclassified Neptuniibacter]MDO6514422.1 EamA family transporter RarD [Neptuniibacter sp. 2_MG-2023]MDO6594444.1 EamA family transporter RarD [Neptuniibacter sp. 1_MG-2023]